MGLSLTSLDVLHSSLNELLQCKTFCDVMSIKDQCLTLARKWDMIWFCKILRRSLKWYYDQKNNSFFSLDFKTMLTKH